MTPAELRRAAERCKLDLTQQVSPDYNDTADRLSVCNHVLATVREDDDIKLCFAFATIQPGTRYNCGTLYIRGLELELHSYEIGGNPCYLEGCDGLRIETRGQLRRLLEGLGVDSGE